MILLYGKIEDYIVREEKENHDGKGQGVPYH